LVQVLGETAANFIIELTVFKTLKKDETRISFGGDAKIFADALQGILGAGSVPIERAIVEQLCSKLGVKFEEKTGYTFSKYIRESKERFEEKS